MSPTVYTGPTNSLMYWHVTVKLICIIISSMLKLEYDDFCPYLCKAKLQRAKVAMEAWGGIRKGDGRERDSRKIGRQQGWENGGKACSTIDCCW